MTGRPLIIGHRGDSFHAPENTLAALQMAVDKGADGVEFDVRLAGDNVPVVIHDPTLERTGARKDAVKRLTSKELGGIDVGSWFNARFSRFADPKFSYETVPTFEAVLAQFQDFGGLVYVELKCEPDDGAALARAVCDLVRGSGLLPHIIVKSFNLAAIGSVRCHLPEVQTAALFSPKIMDFLRRKKHMVKLAHEVGAHQISLHRSLATKSVVRLAAEIGMPVTVWTADNPKWIKRCRISGIKALITNDPGRMIAARDALAKAPGL